MKYAPVIIPTLCRYEKFVQCMESLRKNSWAKYTEIYVAVDYPSKESHWDGYNKICEYLNQDFPEFKAMHITKRPYNCGAGDNSNALKKEVFKRHDRFIYTDDDVEFSPNFLEYIDKTMEYYNDDSDVVAVCGYSYPLEWDVSNGSNVFKSSAGCFMWGTGFWREKYIPIRSKLESGILREEYKTGRKGLWRKKLIDARYIEFLSLGTSDAKCLLDAATDAGIGTYIGLFDKYAIIPVISKTRNFGFDGTGLYCQNITEFAFDASDYNYAHQPIDSNFNFVLCPDTFLHESENKKIWNRFDSRKNIKIRSFVIEIKCFLRKILGDNQYQKLKRIIKH